MFVASSLIASVIVALSPTDAFDMVSVEFLIASALSFQTGRLISDPSFVPLTPMKVKCWYCRCSCDSILAISWSVALSAPLSCAISILF